jgi:hypothetical protein
MVSLQDPVRRTGDIRGGTPKAHKIQIISYISYVLVEQYLFSIPYLGLLSHFLSSMFLIPISLHLGKGPKAAGCFPEVVHQLATDMGGSTPAFIARLQFGLWRRLIRAFLVLSSPISLGLMCKLLLGSPLLVAS